MKLKEPPDIFYTIKDVFKINLDLEIFNDVNVFLKIQEVEEEANRVGKEMALDFLEKNLNFYLESHMLELCEGLVYSETSKRRGWGEGFLNKKTTLEKISDINFILKEYTCMVHMYHLQDMIEYLKQTAKEHNLKTKKVAQDIDDLLSVLNSLESI